MGSSAVTERVTITPSQQTRLLARIANAEAQVALNLAKADDWKRRRYVLVEQAKAGGVMNKDIAEALGMTIPGVVKIIERGRANGG